MKIRSTFQRCREKQNLDKGIDMRGQQRSSKKRWRSQLGSTDKEKASEKTIPTAPKPENSTNVNVISTMVSQIVNPHHLPYSGVFPKMSAIQAQTAPPDDTTEAIDESSLAYKIFTAFVTDSGEISASEEELRDFAAKELNLNVTSLPSDVVESLPLILVAFMNMWSGWHFKSEFKAGKFRKEHYFNRFKKFMIHKMKTVVSQKGTEAVYRYKSAMKSTGRPAGSVSRVKNDFSPYAICIQCPPHMLNTIVFSNSGDDVIMKQHLGSTWRDLNMTQLVNWPHVEVSFRTQDICFVRKQATEFMRYLNFLPHEWLKNCDQVIEHAETLGGKQECYSQRLLQVYAKEYVDALKTVKKVKAAKLEEIQVILTQFLEDVKFLDINSSMATNTVVIFRLSPIPFIRNKKLVKNNDLESDEARVGYCEIITPRVELTMVYFRAVQNEANGSPASFEFTEKIKQKGQQPYVSESELNSVLPFISYKCSFCRVEYDSEDAKKLILDHLRTEHKMEQHVRCTVCKKQFDVVNLATCRWRHKCSSMGTLAHKGLKNISL